MVCAPAARISLAAFLVCALLTACTTKRHPNGQPLRTQSSDADNGLWADPQIIISPTALGAVHIGMTFEQAQDAAGLGFNGSGDGFFYPTNLPSASGHLYVGVSADQTVRCVGAELSESVSTPQGVRIGDSVRKLLATYGSQARFVPSPTDGGMTDYDGYIAMTQAGKLVFMLDRTNSTVTGIAAGGPDLDPNSCTG